jgi:hypothetical protein
MYQAIGLGLSLRAQSGRPLWTPLASVAVHLDFVNDRYYWNGGWHGRSDFAAFTLGGACSMGASGLVVDGTAANLSVSIATATLGISAPFAMIASATPTDTATTYFMASVDAGAASDFMALATSANRIAQVLAASVTQANVAAAGVTGGTRQTVGANFETNNVLQSVNGATGGTADTSATLPTVTTLRVGERPANTAPYLGTIHHLVIYAGAHDQTLLNTRTGIVHAL